MGLNSQARTGVTVSTSAYYAMAGSTTPSYSTTPAVVQFYVDITAVAAGDEFLVKLVRKVDGTNIVTVYEGRIIAETKKGWASPQFIIAEGSGWDWSIERTAGSDRSLDMRVDYVT